MKNILNTDIYLCAKTFIMQFNYEIQISIVQFIMQLYNDIYSIYIYTYTYTWKRYFLYVKMNISDKREEFLLWELKSNLAMISDIKECSACLKLAFWGQKRHKKCN